jgi:hypothetical protein
MPRLEGRRSNTGWYIMLVVMVLVLLLVLLDYTGVLNLIPNFGPS